MKTLREFIENSYSSIPLLPLNEDFDPIPSDAKHEGFYKSTELHHKDGTKNTVQISFLRPKGRLRSKKYHTIVHVNKTLHKEGNKNISPENAQEIAHHVKTQTLHFLAQNLTGGAPVIARGNSAKKTKTYQDIEKYAGKIAKKTGYIPSATRSGVKFTPIPASSSSYAPPKTIRDTYPNEPYDDLGKSKKLKFTGKKLKSK